MVYKMLDKIKQKKKELDSYRPFDSALEKNLADWFRVEVTCTSNAIEGNTLTRQETALVLEKGMTVRGKSLQEHLEATNHAKAWDWIKSTLPKITNEIDESYILKIHSMILHGIDDVNAGCYRTIPVRIAGSGVVLPNFMKVPDLMREFMGWLGNNSDMDPVLLAAEAHYKLVTIHPFTDGNGRTARLLMNVILMMFGYPAAIIKEKDRMQYISSLEKAQLGGAKDKYEQLIIGAVDRSLDIYLNALKNKEDVGVGINEQQLGKDLLKIGELAKSVGESVATIRYWTKEGLLDVADHMSSGYQLYSPKMIERVRKIHKLKEQRYRLDEIKQILKEGGESS